MVFGSDNSTAWTQPIWKNHLNATLTRNFKNYRSCSSKAARCSKTLGFLSDRLSHWMWKRSSGRQTKGHQCAGHGGDDWKAHSVWRRNYFRLASTALLAPSRWAEVCALYWQNIGCQNLRVVWWGQKKGWITVWLKVFRIRRTLYFPPPAAKKRLAICLPNSWRSKP